MANPLFSVQVPRPEPSLVVWEEPKDKAFTVALPRSWTITGEFVKAPPNNRYVRFTAKTPTGGIVFAGDPDLPLSFAAPAPWHPPAMPGRRVAFGEGPMLHHRFIAPYPGTAANYAFAIAEKRFGRCEGVRAEQLHDDIQSIREQAAKAGAWPGQVDAARCRFACEGGMIGEIKLAIWGGGMPGETWYADFIEGFMVLEAEIALARAVLSSVKVLEPGQRKDEIPQALLDVFTKAMADADKKDVVTERDGRRVIDGSIRANPGRVTVHKIDV